MSRGAQRTTRQLTDQQLAQQNAQIGQESQSDAQDRSLLMPTIQSLLNSQGYTPQQQSAITQQSLGASNTAFDALRERAANRTAATNNSAGYGDLTAQLGREQAQTDASQAQQNQIAFANQQLKEQMAGLSALGQTYGVDTNLLGKAMGVPAELLGVRQRVVDGIIHRRIGQNGRAGEQHRVTVWVASRRRRLAFQVPRSMARAPVKIA